eukprot:2493426-Pleurochrysis_carterae.AAC.1
MLTPLIQRIPPMLILRLFRNMPSVVDVDDEEDKEPAPETEFPASRIQASQRQAIPLSTTRARWLAS